MKRSIKVQKFSTSENEVFFFWNFNLAERFFAEKPENFNAVFSGEDDLIETDYDFSVNGIEVKEIEDGIFKYKKDREF